MFIRSHENLEIARRFWRGETCGRLLWVPDLGNKVEQVALKAGYATKPELPGYNHIADFYQRELGVLMWGTHINPTKVIVGNLEITEKWDGNTLERVHKSHNGVLDEKLKDGQLIKHKVNNPQELKILIDIWKGIQIQKDVTLYDFVSKADAGKWPILLCSDMPSAIQYMLQYVTGVENFWYLQMDCPTLLEEAMEVWQDIQQQKYDVMTTLQCDGFYQSENTSTTMISPEYYQRYSLKYMQQFTKAAQKAGVRSLVHMCGLLKDLMPLLKQTGMNGIHSLSPAPIGNTSFEYAYQTMPKDFFALGRFGSLHWVGRTKQEIMDDLAMILPQHIYKEHAFVLLVTGDETDYTLEDVYRVRDCINEYEKQCCTRNSSSTRQYERCC